MRATLRNDPEAFDKILTDWEQELLGLLGRGLSNEEVAKQAGLERDNDPEPPVPDHGQTRHPQHPRIDQLRDREGLYARPAAFSGPRSVLMPEASRAASSRSEARSAGPSA